MEAAKPRRIYLVLAALAFAGWIGWLAFLALTTTKPVILSRPQFLMSNIEVIAQVDQLDKTVEVLEILYPTDPEQQKRVPRIIEIANLSKCQKHWQGPGRYLVPLTTDDKIYYVARTPESHWKGLRLGPDFGPPVIYPDTPSTRGQFRQIRKEE